MPTVAHATPPPQASSILPTPPVWQQIGALPLRGNLIPHQWYTALKLPSGKPDLVAITLLAEIVYWYRPVVERDPVTGQMLGLRKKFKADMLQRSYQAFADQFGFTKRQVMEAMYRLEKTYGVVHKELRHIDTPYGRCANVLFVAPLPEALRAITCDQQTSHVPQGDVSHSNVTRLTAQGETNTESTPKSSQKISGVEDDFSSFLGVDEKEHLLAQAEDRGYDEHTADDVSTDVHILSEHPSPPASSAVLIPLFPSRMANPPRTTPQLAPAVQATRGAPRVPAPQIPTPAPGFPGWPEAPAHQDEAVLRAQFAALPAAQQAWLTQQAQHALTRRGVPPWMQIRPVVEAAIWELQQATAADGTGRDIPHAPGRTLLEPSLVPCEGMYPGRGARFRHGRSRGGRPLSLAEKEPPRDRAPDGQGGSGGRGRFRGLASRAPQRRSVV